MQGHKRLLVTATVHDSMGKTIESWEKLGATNTLIKIGFQSDFVRFTGAGSEHLKDPRIQVQESWTRTDQDLEETS